MKALFLFLLSTVFLASISSLGGIEGPPTAAAVKHPSIVLLYTQSGDEAEEFENLGEVAQFALDQFNVENKTSINFKLISIDDKDDPLHAQKELKTIFKAEKPIAVIGPLYSNVAMGLKEFINEQQVPLISIFATHNDLTRDTGYIFRICASNKRLVRSMADFLIPEVQKHHLHITTFKDLSDDYSTDLADNFRRNISGIDANYNEILFRGLHGIERLRDLNSKIWNPTKKDVLFLPTRDIVAGHVLTAMESDPYLVAAIDTVNFVHLMKKIKSQKTHIRLVTTSQWLPQKSEFSKKIEDLFQKRFKRPMKIPSALTFDAAYTVAAAFHRSTVKSIPFIVALRDSTKITGVTGLILLGPDGERVFTDHFLKEEIIE